MKRISKILALLLAFCMLLAVGAFASGEPSGDPSAEPAAAGKSVEEAFIEYIHEWLLDELEINGNMTIEQVEDEFMPLVEQMNFVDFPAEMIYSGMLEQGVPMTFDEFAAQYVPEGGEALSVEDAFIEYIHEWLLDELEINGNMTIEQVEDEFMPLVEQMNFVDFPAEMIYNGMLEQGVPMTFEEFAAQYVPAGGEVLSVEDAFIEYIHEWLIAEDEINDNMDENIRENEFMPLVRAWNFVDFPAEMIYSGMLEQGVPMTFEEFKAQYVPAAAPAAGGYTADEAGWKQYLKDYVSAVPAAQEHLDEFFAAIDANAFYSMPGDMLFQDTFWGHSALTLDEFVAAGGVVEIPDFSGVLTAD